MVSCCFWIGLLVFGGKNDGLTGHRFPNFFTKYDLRGQIVTKMNMEASNNCPVRYDFVNIY